MNDIRIRKAGRIGHVTLARPAALNALTWEMALAIERALDDWAQDAEVACVLVDAEGERAFCAGGDLLAMYETAAAGDFGYGRRFWRDEYRLNAKIAAFPKPYVALMQGFTMGGGVGVACHGSHRVAGGTTRISMPECAIGLVPDVGGSWLLARAPGRLGEYLGLTGARMTASDAILAGFADYHIPEDRWRELTETLIETGDASAVAALASDPPDGALAGLKDRVDRDFAGATAAEILGGLPDDDFGRGIRATVSKFSPVSMACTVELIHRARAMDGIRASLQAEFRFTWRSASEGDFVEGIRAAIIDKDRNPRWRHGSVDEVDAALVAHMLAPLGAEELTFREGRKT